MFGLITAFALLWSAVSGFTIVNIHNQNVPFYTTTTVATTTCINQAAVIDINRIATLNVWIHEFAHAVDCHDNGVMDSSPAPWLCQNSPVCGEIYALYVENTLDISGIEVLNANSQGR